VETSQGVILVVTSDRLKDSWRSVKLWLRHQFAIR